jgi:CubicO group peptidase (beta-lactamase class C family)
MALRSTGSAKGTAGFSQERLAQIAPAIQTAIDGGELSGAVTLLWRNGEIAQVNTLGKRDIERNLPMQRDTLFRIASMTKPITSVLILMLMEEGKLKLDDPITKWAPEFAGRSVLRDAQGSIEDTYPSPREITIEDLLTHRSGLAYAFNSLGPIAEAYKNKLGDVFAIELTSDEFIKVLASLPLIYAPGERFYYGHSTDVLGFIAERVERKPFRDLLFERIVSPLDLVDTDFWVPPAKRNRAATVYFSDQNSKALMPLPFKSGDAAPIFCSGGGGLISTADDYLKFARLLLGQGEADGVRLLRPETVALMTADKLTEAQHKYPLSRLPFWEENGFGLGISMITDAQKRAWIGPATVGSFGWPGVFSTWWCADPAENMVMLYLAQSIVPPTPENTARFVLGTGTPWPTFQTLTYTALGR